MSRRVPIAALAGALLTIVSAGPGACGEGEEPTPSTVVVTELPTRSETTRDGLLVAELPTDLLATIQERSLMGTSADGSFRLYVEHRTDEKLPEVLGAMKDELIGLGWEAVEEQHFESAVLVQMGRGPKQQRLHRETWIIAASGRVLVCDAIAGEYQVGRLGAPLRKLCQTLRVTP